MKEKLKLYLVDALYAIVAGLIVATAYYFFQNSNKFAPGGVGGLATITNHLIGAKLGKYSWEFLMVLFNVPIFVLVSIFVNKRLGLFLVLYISMQSIGSMIYGALGCVPYCEATAAQTGEDFEILLACIATGVISGFGFSVMLKRFGAVVRMPFLR